MTIDLPLGKGAGRAGEKEIPNKEALWVLCCPGLEQGPREAQFSNTLDHTKGT